jgi:predicted acyl esterase
MSAAQATEKDAMTTSRIMTCAICGKTVRHVVMGKTQPITTKDGVTYYLVIYWPENAHRQATGHDSTISVRVNL